MISFQTRSVSTKTHMLKIGFSAKLSLRRSVSLKKKNMHRLVTDTVRSRVVCWFLYILSRIMFNSLLWLDFLSNWSCCSHNLLASKKTDLNQENSPFTLPFRSLLPARCRQLCLWVWLCTGRVLRMCSPHKLPTSTTGQPSGWKGIFRNSRKFCDCQAFSFSNPFRLPGI